MLELVEARTIDDPRYDLTHVVGLSVVTGNDAHEVLDLVGWLLGLSDVEPVLGGDVEVLDDVAHHPQRLGLVLGEVVGDPRLGGVDLRPAQVLGSHLLPGGRFDQRGAR